MIWNSMKVSELIERLKTYNQDAEVIGVFDYTGYPLKSIGFGSSDGCTKETCDDVSLHFTNDRSEVES